MLDSSELFSGQPLFASKIPMVKPYLPDWDRLAKEMQTMLASGILTKGTHLQHFEEELAAYLGVKYALAVSSCTTGLMLVYKGLHLTGEVIVPSFTFMATVSGLIWAGLRPVFVDIDVSDMTIAPAAIEAAITPQTSAIVAVHNFGNPAQIEPINRIAHKYDLKLIFDAAHGFGAHYQRKHLGAQGHAQVFSTSPTKLLITGEGGIVTTADANLATYIRMSREYGISTNYNSLYVGMNARMPEFNAILGRRGLPLLEHAVRRRNEIATLYKEHLADLPGLGFQEIAPENRSSYKDFAITVDAEQAGFTRDVLASVLASHNVDSRTYYDPPVHRQTAYQVPNQAWHLPGTDWLAKSILCLPIWSNMDDTIVEKIYRIVRHVWTEAPKQRIER